ncbi:hypothetical protein HH308_18055 [Gordonia sp. TBRC 11910]|uniref:Uncharacterized protein n=1 Tax=Gordonia asplenii TaxID=2725283 RepID=A0A848KXQ1_9ACTN|nr:hypothetical protein [Gordonia asplenii]NMO03119.1 hypothetical protein [Gordonia asplenii]
MMPTDRYADATRGEDLGLGADEVGVRRFTRGTDSLDVVQSALDAAADTAAERFERYRDEHLDDRESPGYELVRTAMFAAKDRADKFARETTKPSTHPAKNVVEGSNTNTQQRN